PTPHAAPHVAGRHVAAMPHLRRHPRIFSAPHNETSERKMTILKQFCSLAVAACLVLAAGAASADEAYPTRPVRLIVGFAAGSTADVGARILSRKLGEI